MKQLLISTRQLLNNNNRSCSYELIHIQTLNCVTVAKTRSSLTTENSIRSYSINGIFESKSGKF